MFSCTIECYLNDHKPDAIRTAKTVPWSTTLPPPAKANNTRHAMLPQRIRSPPRTSSMKLCIRASCLPPFRMRSAVAR